MERRWAGGEGVRNQRGGRLATAIDERAIGRYFAELVAGWQVGVFLIEPVSHVWKVAFGGGAAQQVTQGPGAAEAMESADGKRLYYFRNDRHDGIWTAPVEGGAEEVIPELADVKPTRSWAVRADGIVFFQHSSALAPLIRFFDFATRRVTTILTPERPPGMTAPGLDLSPDGRRLLYTQVDHRIEGLMMLENFY